MIVGPPGAHPADLASEAVAEDPVTRNKSRNGQSQEGATETVAVKTGHAHHPLVGVFPTDAGLKAGLVMTAHVRPRHAGVSPIGAGLKAARVVKTPARLRRVVVSPIDAGRRDAPVTEKTNHVTAKNVVNHLTMVNPLVRHPVTANVVHEIHRKKTGRARRDHPLSKTGFPVSVNSPRIMLKNQHPPKTAT